MIQRTKCGRRAFEGGRGRRTGGIEQMAHIQCFQERNGKERINNDERPPALKFVVDDRYVQAVVR